MPSVHLYNGWNQSEALGESVGRSQEAERLAAVHTYEAQLNLNAEGTIPQAALWTGCLLSCLLTEGSWKPYHPPACVIIQQQTGTIFRTVSMKAPRAKATQPRRHRKGEIRLSAPFTVIYSTQLLVL